MLLVATSLWSTFWTFIGGMAVGAVIAFFVTKHMFEKQIKENPPINEKMIRAMYMQMGRKPSEAQIRAIMKSMGQ
ncbi:hypothetical protein AOC36_04375 [Erysipelothrix larvae]|uniref:Uncharacterized protein n=2 Tax=Erysipelothrix larvae TaxID=1514105 RepID=A0A0X8GZD7_9FIRM|nr:YneF family protein [Erysipelothrix larvae]AMC93233.1 hypothetical protein AOC36_04375 [Erysipelothrix larvae]